MLSSMEAKYITQMHAAKEALWLWSFLWKLKAASGEPLTINCNNQGMIALAKDNKFHTHTKHIDMCYHFVHEVLEDAKVVICYIPMNDNVPNIVTKLLMKPKFWAFVELLGLCANACKV